MNRVPQKTKNRPPAIIYVLFFTPALVTFILGLLIGVWVTNAKASYEPPEPVKQVVYRERAAAKPVIVEPGTEPKQEYLDIPLSDELQDYTREVCGKYNLPFKLAIAVMGVESEFQADAIGGGRDYGLFQIRDVNHEWLSNQLGVTDFLDPQQNIRAGVYILSGYLSKYTDKHRALMAYNMGETGAKRLWDKGIFESAYSRKVTERERGIT